MSFQQYIPYGGLLEHHLRIGDTIFYVPPTAISVHRQMKNQRISILRARNSLPVESGYFDRVIEFTLFFPDIESINNELRPLLAQVKKCPFLPIENTYLNDIHKIEAVTIVGVTVQTTPGFPNTLQAQIQCYAFEPASYIADEDDRTFDEMFDWPLFRWYYSRNLDPQIGNMFHTYFEPLYGELDHSFKFRIAAMDDLDAIAAWRKEKKKLIRDFLRETRENFWGNEKREEEFHQKYDKLYQKAMFEYQLHYEDWNLPGLVLTDLSIGFENNIASLQLQEDASPTHQYLGSQDTILVARFQTDNIETIAELEALVNRATYMTRTYHKEVSNGFLEFDHPLARLFGVRNVTIEDMQTNTIEGYPGAHEVVLTMIAYNRAERKLNEVQWLSETAQWDISKYEELSLLGIFTDFDLGISEDYQGSDIIMDMPLISPFARFVRFMWDRPMFEQMFLGLKNFLAGHHKTPADLDQEGVKRIIYDESIKQFFRAAEVYPDLELPTYAEVAMAGFHVENTNDGVFVDPDFFIKYKKGTLFWENLLKSIEQNYQVVLRDALGGEAVVHGGEIKNINKVTSEQIQKGKKDFQEASGQQQMDASPIAKDLIDTGNLKKEQMEALIRQKAQQFGLNQNFPLAFARAMDEELKQFYDKGMNAKQGKVVNRNSSAPVMMNNHFEFYTNPDGTIDGEYIGVMKVRRLYGSNVNLLGKNIEYNVETGIRKMADFYAELARIHANSANGGKKIYNEQYVYDLFGLKNKRGTFDVEKARFAGVVMLYLGFDREYMALVKDNKRPPRQIVQLVQKVLDNVKNEEQWTNQQIHNRVKNLPIKDFKSVGTQASAVTSTTSASYVDDNNQIYKGMLHDMLRYDKRGRLVRAFPTFFLTFIDEGQYIGTIKLSDQFFQYKAVMDIMYTNNRKEASSTLVLEMSNIYGTLDDAEKGMDLTHTGYSEVFKAMTLPGAVTREAERSRHRNPNYYKSIMLRTGTRIHFRMGYGSNPMEMPTIMNGTITSITNNKESITVIAQDDGIELTNKIRADVNETTDGGFLFSKKEPTEIVDELLTDSQGFFRNLWAGLSNKEFENHSLGIMHFGSQQQPQGWAQLQSFLGGIPVGAAAGIMGGVIGAIAGSLSGGLFGGVLAGKDSRTIGEINMNVYQTTGLTNEEHDQWWTKIKDAFGIGKADEPGININLFDKSVWDVLNICASVGDDHIVAVHPFGFRNTIFSGKPYFPLHYDYIVDAKQEKVLGTAVKPFRQFHVYDSATSILDNSIEATEEYIRTVAVGVYMNEGEMDTTSPIFVDTNIWPEKQRVVNIDTTMNAQGVRLIQHIPLIGGLLNKPLKWYFDEGVAIKIAAAGLRDYVKDMYDGYLTVMGDPSVKPYDQMWVFDTYNDIVGLAEVKEVTQIMNHQMGYITMIKPDAVVVNSDRRAMGFAMTLQAIAGSALITYALRKKLKTSKYAGHLPILNAAWAATQNQFDRLKERFQTNRVTKKLYDTLTGKRPSNENDILQKESKRKSVRAKAEDVARWAKNGMLNQLEKWTGEKARNNLEEILRNSREFGYNTFNHLRLKEKITPLLTSGSRKLRKLKGVGEYARMAWAGTHAAAGPIGWIAFAIEALVIHLITATVAEFIERWLFTRQAVMIAPLIKGGLEFTAGINGHKGSVIGDPPDFWQRFMTNEFSAVLLGFFGVDAWKYRQDYVMENDLQMQTNSSVSRINVNSMAQDLLQHFRKQPRNVPELQHLYEEDRKAALEQVNRRLALLNSRYTKAVHPEEEKSWEEWKKQIGDWFSDLWEQIKLLFGGKDDGQVCIPKGDVPTNGKAVNLSKYFSVIGPKIEEECKRQGLSPYAEILKAKCMQESGGNYLKYPDVMQASESLGKPIGWIKDVDLSIRQGVKYFGEIIKKCNGDIKLALQSYNYGKGFIDYAMKRGGKYTPELAWSFAEEMVKKYGRISRIPPGYGDSKYVERVLRYYQGDLPSGECENAVGNGPGGASSCPSVTGREGKRKYQTSGEGLTDLRTIPQRPFGLAIVGGTSKVRPGTAEALVNMALLYKKATGKTFKVTSGNRPGDPNWHGTGWAVDIDTPNTMRIINGKMRFPNGTDKNDARALCQAAIEAGFRGLYFGDWDIVQEMNQKYGAGTMTYDPGGHWNHLHCSYPICKKK